MPITSNKRFKGDNNQNANNDVGSFNKVYIDFSGAPIMTLVCFCLALILAAIVFMIVRFGSLVILLVVLGTILLSVVGIVVAVAVLVGFGLRHISGTRTQLTHDRAQELWSRTVYPVGGHIVVHNPATRELTVHNARDVVENRHYQQNVLPAQVDHADMPSFDDLTFEKGESSWHEQI